MSSSVEVVSVCLSNGSGLHQPLNTLRLADHGASWFCCTGFLGENRPDGVQIWDKGPPAPDRVLESLGIMRLRFVWVIVVRAFVTDPDVWPHFWLPMVLDQRTASGRSLFTFGS